MLWCVSDPKSWLVSKGPEHVLLRAVPIEEEKSQSRAQINLKRKNKRP